MRRPLLPGWSFPPNDLDLSPDLVALTRLRTASVAPQTKALWLRTPCNRKCVRRVLAAEAGWELIESKLAEHA